MNRDKTVGRVETLIDHMILRTEFIYFLAWYLVLKPTVKETNITSSSVDSRPIA